MRPDEAFDEFQTAIDAEPRHVREGRRRRDIFRDAFKTLDEVAEVVPSGSLARGTQLDPIHDVDLIVVFAAAAHPEWGGGRGTADSALRHTGERVMSLLGEPKGTERECVRTAVLRNHVVKCYLESRDRADSAKVPEAFTVEVMPALRDGSVLVVPERRRDRWQPVNPEYLMARVRKRQEDWAYFIRMVRVIKYWNRFQAVGMKSLAAEVLVLDRMPGSGHPRSRALQQFFTAAANAVMLDIDDPAGLCGAIQPNLNRDRVRARLLEASDIATEALTWEELGDYNQAICCWRQIFGPRFPEPPGGCGDRGGGPVGVGDELDQPLGRPAAGIGLGPAGGGGGFGQGGDRPVRPAGGTGGTPTSPPTSQPPGPRPPVRPSTDTPLG